VLALCAVFVSSAAACSSDSDKHPSLINAGGDIEPGGGRSGAGTGGESDLGGASDSGGDAGEGGDAGSNTVPYGGSGGGHPLPGPSLCSNQALWASSANVDGVSTAANETLLSITPDELDLAFLRDGALYVAHRAQANAAFGAGDAVLVPSGWTASQGAALSADGKRLILISTPDQAKLGELSRATRDAAFSEAVDETAFSAVNQNAIYAGKHYASPVVSTGDGQLFLNSAFADGSSTVVVSTSADGAWAPPKSLAGQLLNGAMGKRRLPTGVSADERTLFYFNEETSLEEARFRDSALASSPLYDIMSLGTRRGAIPNSACNRLYSGFDSDVVVEQD
jgi:hypothetical protein